MEHLARAERWAQEGSPRWAQTPRLPGEEEARAPSGTPGEACAAGPWPFIGGGAQPDGVNKAKQSPARWSELVPIFSNCKKESERGKISR